MAVVSQICNAERGSAEIALRISQVEEYLFRKKDSAELRDCKFLLRYPHRKTRTPF